MLFGRSDEAVRRAISEELVEVPLKLHFGAKPINLIALDSALAYWMRSARPGYMQPLKSELEQMRLYGAVITFPGGIDKYRVLHAFPLVEENIKP